MRSTIKRSAARSASVTRSMSPLFDTCSARPNLSARICPASRAVWMAKLIKWVSQQRELQLLQLTPPVHEPLEAEAGGRARDEEEAELQLAGLGLGQLVGVQVVKDAAAPLVRGREHVRAEAPQPAHPEGVVQALLVVQKLDARGRLPPRGRERGEVFGRAARRVADREREQRRVVEPRLGVAVAEELP